MRLADGTHDVVLTVDNKAFTALTAAGRTIDLDHVRERPFPDFTDPAQVDDWLSYDFLVEPELSSRPRIFGNLCACDCVYCDFIRHEYEVETRLYHFARNEICACEREGCACAE